MADDRQRTDDSRAAARQTRAQGAQPQYVNTYLWGPALTKAGLERVRSNGMHALRHWYASVLLEAGVSINAVSECLGHADPRFTLRIYTHLMPSSEDKAPRWSTRPSARSLAGRRRPSYLTRGYRLLRDESHRCGRIRSVTVTSRDVGGNAALSVQVVSISVPANPERARRASPAHCWRMWRRTAAGGSSRGIRGMILPRGRVRWRNVGPSTAA